MQKNKLTILKIATIVFSLLFVSSLCISAPRQVFAKTTTKTSIAEKNDDEKNENEHQHKTRKISKVTHKKIVSKKVVTSPTTKPKTVTTTTTTASYSLADISTHNSSTSCWTTIGGKVYNLTSWINQHPGGRQAILSLCGTDGTAAFNDQHGGQARPAQELKSFLIGTLK